MLRLSAILLLCLCVISSNAQTSSAMVESPELPQQEKSTSLGKNIAYLEIGGICGYYSANFQHNFRVSNRFDLGVGIAMSVVPYGGKKDYDFSPRLAFQGQAIYKMRQHEIGLGAQLCYYSYHYTEKVPEDERYQDLRGTLGAQLGYGYSTKNHIYFGAYLTPYFMDSDDLHVNSNDFELFFLGGVRIGYRFR